jgi:hypothetical protein
VKIPVVTDRRYRLAAAVCWLAIVHSLPAQIGVSTISTTTTDLANSNTNGTTFQNTTVAVSSFLDVAGNIYTANTVAGAAYVRRNTTAGNDNNTSAWYDQGGSTTQFSAPYAATDPSLLLGNNILRGSDNTFANGSGDATAGNIERLDFVFSAGVTTNLSTAFAVFDRGDAGAHDSVKIAVITGWNAGTSQVTAYGGNLIGVNSVNYGPTNVVTNFDYNLFRYSNGDNLGSPYWNSNTETGNQGIGGTIISLSDLGIAAGTTIYGYSLMGYDVTNGGSMSNLVNWNNTTYYATDTTGATGTGGIDLSAVNGVLYNRVAPEPTTYGAIFMGVALGGWYVRRRKPARVTV